MNLKCILFGHKYKKEPAYWKAGGYWHCTRSNCDKVSLDSPRAYLVKSYFIALLMVLSVFSAGNYILFANEITFRTVDCCNSMYPVLDNGPYSNETCYVMMKFSNGTDLEIGDVVSYKYGYDRGTVHRIIDNCTIALDFYVNETDFGVYSLNYQQGWILRGDNNPEDDGCIPTWAIRTKAIAGICEVDLKNGTFDIKYF